jgi:hypothetical protein
MAILSLYEVQVFVNDVALQEYDDDNDKQTPDRATSPTVVKYIEAASGAEFSVRSRIRPGWDQEEDMCWDVYLDGNLARSTVYLRKEYLEGFDTSIADAVRSCSGGEWYRRKFKFADIVTGEPHFMPLATSF